MTQNLIAHQPHTPATGTPRQNPARAEADAVLRDLAYVLHLTRRVRTEIEAEREAREPVAV